MPSIKDRIGNIEGFEPVAHPQVQSPMSRPNRESNPYIRCPIPPINAGSDTLRQFDESGVTPTRRVLPLPVSTVAGGNTIINTTTASSSTSSGSSSSSTTATLTATSVTVSVPVLAANAVYQTSAAVAKALQLIQVTATQPVEIRIYGSASAQGADASRAVDIAPLFETQSGLVTDVVFDTAPYIWNWQNRLVANADSPQTSNIYITVVNPSTLLGVSASTVTIQYLPLET